jgi:hypothetical protein
MTFLEIQDEVMNRLNLTSDSARTRIKGLINSRYRAVTSGVNMKRTRAATVNVAAVANTPTVTLSNVARLGTLYDPTLLKNVLTEVTLPFIRQMDAADAVVGVPTNYAIVSHLASSMVLRLYPIPSANNTLKADVLSLATDLSADGDIPVFPEDYHDLLVDGVMADEYMKLEKQMPLAEVCENRFRERMSELRYFIHKVWPYSNLMP